MFIFSNFRDNEVIQNKYSQLKRRFRSKNYTSFKIFYLTEFQDKNILIGSLLYIDI